jgi:hypothetical protein
LVHTTVLDWVSDMPVTDRPAANRPRVPGTCARAAWRLPLVLAGLMAGVVVVFHDLPGNDVATFYGPLAEALAEGDFQHSTFHFIPPLIPLLAGLLALLGFDAFTALKIVSSALYLLAMVPLYRIACRVVSPDAARLTLLLYAIHPRLLRYGACGQTESAKTLFVLLAIDLIMVWHDRRRPWAAAGAGVAIGLLSLARGEGMLFAPVLLAMMVFGPRTAGAAVGAASGQPRRRPPLTGMLLAAAVAVMLLAPWLYVQHRALGFPVPDSKLLAPLKALGAPVPAERLARLNANLTSETRGVVPAAPALPPPADAAPGDQAAGVAAPGPAAVKAPAPPSRVARNVSGILQGLYLTFAPLIVLGMVTMRPLAAQRSRYRWYAAWVLALIVLNVAMFWVNASVTKRYVAPLTPLLLVWGAAGAQAVTVWLARTRIGTRSAVTALTVLFMAGHAWDGLIEVRESVRRPTAYRAVGHWIRDHRQSLDSYPGPAALADDLSRVYRRGRDLLILSARPQISFYAGADLIRLEKRAPIEYRRLVNLVHSAAIDVVVRTPDMAVCCPEFDRSCDSDFTLVNDQWRRDGILVYVPRRDAASGHAPAYGRAP